MGPYILTSRPRYFESKRQCCYLHGDCASAFGGKWLVTLPVKPCGTFLFSSPSFSGFWLHWLFSILCHHFPSYQGPLRVLFSLPHMLFPLPLLILHILDQIRKAASDYFVWDRPPSGYSLFWHQFSFLALVIIAILFVCVTGTWHVVNKCLNVWIIDISHVISFWKYLIVVKSTDCRARQMDA